MLIKNGSVFNGEGFETRDVAVRGDRFAGAEAAPADGEVVDAAGCYVIPGFVNEFSQM